MGNRDTRFPQPKQELYYFDKHSKTYKPIVDEDGMLPVQSIQKKWKDSFTTTDGKLDSDNWDIIQVGSNQSINVTGGELVITSGTTINQETIIQSKEYFSDPFRVLFGFKASQKIANTDLLLEAVSINPETKEPDGLHSVAWRISGSDSTTTTNAVYITQNGGLPPLVSGTASIANAVTSTNILELELFADEVWYHARALDSATGRNASWVRHQQIPDPNALFKIRIRVLNRGTAPASSTTYSFQFVTVVDYSELTAEITAGRGGGSAGQALGVQITGGTLPTVTTITTANISNKASAVSVTTSAITTATPFSSASIDAGSTYGYTRIRARFIFDQPVQVEFIHGSSATMASNKVQQIDNIPANTPTVIEYPLIARYSFIRITNKGTATTTVHECLAMQLGM